MKIKLLELFTKIKPLEIETVLKIVGITHSDLRVCYYEGFHGKGFAIQIGKSNRYAFRDWLCYDGTYNTVFIFNRDFELKVIGYDVVKDTDFWIEGKQIDTNIKCKPHPEIKEMFKAELNY